MAIVAFQNILEKVVWVPPYGSFHAVPDLSSTAWEIQACLQTPPTITGS